MYIPVSINCLWLLLKNTDVNIHLVCGIKLKTTNSDTVIDLL